MAENLININAHISRRLVKGQQIFSTRIESANETLEGTFIGFMQFVNNSKNWCRTLNFYVPTGVKIRKAVLHTRSLDFLASGGSQRAQDINIYLNPTKTKVSPAGPANDYYVYSGGTTLKADYNPAADEETTENPLLESQIAAIEQGWNSIVAQCETSDPTDANRGYLTMILILDTFLST